MPWSPNRRDLQETPRQSNDTARCSVDLHLQSQLDFAGKDGMFRKLWLRTPRSNSLIANSPLPSNAAQVQANGLGLRMSSSPKKFRDGSKGDSTYDIPSLAWRKTAEMAERAS